MAYLWLYSLNLTTRGPQPLNALQVNGTGLHIVIVYPVRTR